jgi:hypothetical protein
MLPLSEDSLRAIVMEYASFRAKHARVLGDPALVEPTAEYFPEAFVPEPDALTRLLRRALTYAPVAEGVVAALAFHEPSEGAGGGCGTGSCGPGKAAGGCGPGAAGGAPEFFGGELLTAADGTYGVVVSTADCTDPVRFAAHVARGVGAIVLEEAGESALPEETAAKSEIVAVACGLGLLLFNGASVYAKACGGLKEVRATHLSVNELAVALALFCRVHGHAPTVVRRHVPVTQTEAFSEALAWVDSNEELVAALRDHPRSVADGFVPLAATKGPLARLWGKLFGGRKDGDAALLPAAPPKRRARSPEEEARLRDAKALVEEALADR